MKRPCFRVILTAAIVLVLLGCDAPSSPAPSMSVPQPPPAPPSPHGATTTPAESVPAAAPTPAVAAQAVIPPGSFQLTVVTDKSDDKQLRKKLVLESPDPNCFIKFGPVVGSDPEPGGFHRPLDKETKYLLCVANYGVIRDGDRAVKIEYGVGYSFLARGKELKEGEEMMGLPLYGIRADQPPVDLVGFMSDGQRIHKIGDTVVLWKNNRSSLILQVTKQK